MTHLELLQTLPSPYREQAIEAIKMQNGKNANEIFNESKFPSLWSLLQHTEIIDWAKTLQGYLYWDNVSAKIFSGEFDKKDRSVTLPMEDWERLDTLVTNLTHESPRFKEICALLDKIKHQLKP